MTGFPSPFGGSTDDDLFDEYDEFVAAHIPEPGGFLEDHEILTGAEHVAFHTTTRDIFEERGVYDMTFGYNLARLNLDSRHPDAGYRYAVDADDSSILRAEFTPTTQFCPQSDTLTKGSFRAWNGLEDRHKYDLVRVRVDDMHQRSGHLNRSLETLEDRYLETGSVSDLGPDTPDNESPRGKAESASDRGEAPSQDSGSDVPF
jgi:hypothetical protein